MAIEFRVAMDAEKMQGNSVLVFLRPIPPHRNNLIHAWQVLSVSEGTSESFEYDAVITTNVTSRRYPPHYIISETMEVQPGSLLEVVSSSELSAKLQMADSSLARDKLTPHQVGVINRTEPYIQLDCNWLVSGRPVVTMPDLEEGGCCTFEYEPNLYFGVAMPPLVGQCYDSHVFSNMTSYPIPTTTTEVFVTVSSNKGGWDFAFGEKI